MNRREILRTIGAAALAPLTSIGSDAQQEVRAQLNLHQTVATIPDDFLGLGYEISSVAQKGLFRASNGALIQFVRSLGPAGVIRIGGNTSDLTAPWSADAQPVSAPKRTAVNADVIKDLARFLRATGWRLIWGLNLGTGTRDSAVEEAAYVASVAGDSLLAFEIGNEPDLFSRNGLRPSTYNYSEFQNEFTSYREAILKRAPNAPFAGPDAATKTDWVSSFAREEGSKLKLLTHHYYAGGPPKNPLMTIENLLKSDARFIAMTDQLRSVSQSARIPYRLVELNSCFGGGKPGVSDTFASALWGLDLMFTLASAGGNGLNIETGVNQLGFISSYTPIDQDAKSNYSARPLYYAMLAFALSGKGRLVELEYDASGVNFRGYAAIAKGGELWLTLINKDLAKAVNVRLAVPRGFSSVEVIRLAGPSAESKTGVTLGRAEVTSDGRWLAKKREKLATPNGKLEIGIPAANAALVNLTQ